MFNEDHDAENCDYRKWRNQWKTDGFSRGIKEATIQKGKYSSKGESRISSNMELKM